MTQAVAQVAQANGGDFGGRLHLVELPACALTTPQVPACRDARPLSSSNDVHAHTLSAPVTTHRIRRARLITGYVKVILRLPW